MFALKWGDQTTEAYSTIGLTYILHARDLLVAIGEHFLRFLYKNARVEFVLLQILMM